MCSSDLAATAALTESGELSLEHMLFHDIGGGRKYFSNESGEGDDDGGFNEEYYLRAEQRDNRFDIDPMLPTTAFDPLNPRFAPHGGSPASANAAPVPEGEFWDQGADYLGAIRPGAGQSWLRGWTAFPAS